MSQHPGAQPPQPPQDPYHGQHPGAEPYGGAPPQPSDPYFGGQSQDPYAPPQDPYQAQQAAEAQAQQRAWQAYAQQQAAQSQPQDASRVRGGSGAAIFGLLLVLLGVWILFGDQLDLNLDWGEVWPVGAVVVGVLMVVASVIPRRRGEG